MSSALVLTSAAFLLRAPVIRHQAVEYMPNNRFPQIEATIESEKGIQSAKLYFRAAHHPDFYYVEMTEETPESFRAVIPMPEKETEKVVYYIEATGNNPDTARTGWYEVKTTDQPVEAYFRGEEPGIVVGKVLESSPNMPPGFQTAGIVGFIGAAGAAIAAGATGGGGAGAGIGAGTAVLVGAAVAAGAGGVAVLASESESGTTEAQSLRACFTTLPDPAIIEEDESITLDGRCSEPGDAITSYRWELGDGRTREGPFIRPIYRTAGSYNITLTVSDGSRSTSIGKRVEVRAKPPETTTTTTSLPSQPLSACIDTTPDPPVIVEGESITLDGRCSTPPESITTYEWDLGDGRSREGPFITPIYQTTGAYTVSLTVSDGLTSNTASRIVTVNKVADLALSVTNNVGGTPNWDQLFQITLTVENLGPNDAPNVTLNGGRPAAIDSTLSGVRPSQGSCTTSTDAYTCNLGEIETGAVATVIADVSFFNPGPGPDSFSYEGSVGGSGFADSNPSNNNASTGIRVQPAPQEADIGVAINGPGGVTCMTRVDYTIDIFNNGPNDASNIQIYIITGPTPMTVYGPWASAPATCTWIWPTAPNPWIIDCSIPTLIRNSQLSVTFGALPSTGCVDITVSAQRQNSNPPDLNPANDALTLFVNVSLMMPQQTQVPLDTSFLSDLDVPGEPGRVSAQVLLNQTQTDTTNDSAPFRHQLRGRSGENEVEGRIISSRESDGRWRFDFAGANHFVPGSLRVETGNVASSDGYSVVFRLSGAPGERIRFTYRLSH